jgi:chromosomal replication initiation ATPase DnaA
MNFFKLKSKVALSDLKEGDILNTSDFACLDSGKIFQFEYVSEPDKAQAYPVKPGLFTIATQNNEFVLIPTEFSSQSILTSYRSTKQVKERIEQFFNKLHIYEELKMSPARRGALLYGAPGVGKSILIQLVTEEYIKDGKTLVVIWPTDKFNAGHVKSFINSFEYQGIDKLILVVEDIGGVETNEAARFSESSLLSLLDNVEKTFKISTFIIATTNYPEQFLENLTNRPGRFDDLIEVSKPSPEERTKLLKFYMNNDNAPQEVVDEIMDKKYNEFTAAHIKEIVIRSKLYDLTIVDSIKQIAQDVQKFKNSFKPKKKLGMGMENDDIG